MDSNTDAQQSPAPIETDGHKRKQQQRMKVPMWFVVPVQSRVEKVESIALYDPDFRCCMMPKTFLERHNCLDKMKPNPATHDSNCGPHQRIGTFQCRFRPVGKPGKTYVATFCVIEDNKGEVQPIFVGQGTSEPRSLANALTSESTQEDEKSAGPILPGPKPKEDSKAKEERLQKRKKEDEDARKEEDERNSKKRREGGKQEEPQSGEGVVK